MADERQDLLANQEMPSLVGTEPAPRGISCSRGATVSVLWVFVALLLAGQVATVYFVAQQHSQITKLKNFHTEMKLKMLSDQLARNHPMPQKKLQMVMANMPLAFVDMSEAPLKANMTDVPQIMLPEFNGINHENLNKLKELMNDGEWKDFQAWMHHRQLFHSVWNALQNESQVDEEQQSPITEAPVLTKCQLQASGKGVHSPLLGSFLPQCAENGEYLPKQCHHSTGFCFCVFKNGTEISGTRTRRPLDCKFPDQEGSTLGWMVEDDLQASNHE